MFSIFPGHWSFWLTGWINGWHKWTVIQDVLTSLFSSFCLFHMCYSSEVISMVPFFFFFPLVPLHISIFFWSCLHPHLFLLSLDLLFLPQVIPPKLQGSSGKQGLWIGYKDGHTSLTSLYSEPSFIDPEEILTFWGQHQSWKHNPALRSFFCKRMQASFLLSHCSGCWL